MGITCLLVPSPTARRVLAAVGIVLGSLVLFATFAGSMIDWSPEPQGLESRLRAALFLIGIGVLVWAAATLFLSRSRPRPDRTD